MAPRSSYLFAILLTRFVGWCTLVETRNGICSRTKMAATTSILSLVSRHITCRHMNTDVTSGLVNAPTPTNPSFPYFPRFLSTFLLASPLPWRFLLSAALQFIPITSSSLLYLFSFFSFLSFPFPSLLFFLLLFLSFWLPPFFLAAFLISKQTSFLPCLNSFEKNPWLLPRWASSVREEGNDPQCAGFDRVTYIARDFDSCRYLVSFSPWKKDSRFT